MPRRLIRFGANWHISLRTSSQAHEQLQGEQQCLHWSSSATAWYHRFIEEFLQRPGADAWELILFGEEPRHTYDRVHLSEYFAGKTAEDLSMGPEGWYEAQGVKTYYGDKIVTIDRAGKTVTSENGVTVAYEKLVLATGSYPFVPPVPGHDSDGCLVYRTIEDLEDITAWANKSKRGVVVGGAAWPRCANVLQNLGLKPMWSNLRRA